MKKGEIVKTDIVKRNAKNPVSILIKEIQTDAFNKKLGTIRGRRVFDNGRIGKTVTECAINRVVSKC